MTESTPPTPDPLLIQARERLLVSQDPTTQYLQRYFRIGYNRAKGLLHQLEGDILGLQDENGIWQMLPAFVREIDFQHGYGLAMFAEHSRLCFYPSSGANALWVLMRLDCDLFVMADKEPKSVSWQHIQAEFKKEGLPIELVQHNEHYLCFTSQGKTAWIFFEDNNITLQRLRRLGLKIHHFVGICDRSSTVRARKCLIYMKSGSKP